MKDEFVMVPRAELVRLQENMDPHRGAVAWGIVWELLAMQHQGEPVAWVRDDGDGCFEFTSPGDGVGYPVYRHADPGEVERLRDDLERQHKRFMAVGLLCDDTLDKYSELQAQLAERDALLRDLVSMDIPRTATAIELARQILSASAEPITTKQETHAEMHIRHKRDFDALDGSGFRYEECRCGVQGSYPVEVKHCVCGKAFASAEPSAPTVHPINMKTMMQAYEQVDPKALLHGTSNWCAAMATALRGVLHAEPSAPVERDERAEFEKAYAEEMAEGLGRPVSQEEIKDLRDGDCYGKGRAYLNGGWDMWQARAALERKS